MTMAQGNEAADHDHGQALQGVFSVVGSTLIWGFGFVTTKWSLTAFGPHWFNEWRYVVALIVGAGVLWVRPSLRPRHWRRDMGLAFLPGILLMGLFFFQTLGLSMSSVANTSFITTLYVVFVPLFQLLLLRQRPHLIHSLLVVLSLVGTALICNAHDLSGLKLGDLSTLLCAMCGGLHFLVIEKRARDITHPFAFNIFQHMWAGLFGLVLALWLEGPQWPVWQGSFEPWFGLFFLAVPSSLVAFFLQIRAQKHISASLASLLCLLESPIATACGYFFMDETLTPSQATGAVVIVMAAALAVRIGPPAPAAARL